MFTLRYSLLILLAATTHAQSPTESFHNLLEAEWVYEMEQHPERATHTGYPGQNHRWTDMSQEAIAARQVHARDLLDRIRAIDPAALNEDDQLNYSLFRKDVEQDIEGQPFNAHYMPVDQLSGVQQDLASTLMRMPANTSADYENILARLDAAPERIQQEIELLKRGLELGLTPPRITLRDVPDQVSNLIKDDPLESPLLEPFTRMPESIDSATQSTLTESAKKTYESEIVPALNSFHTFLTKTYIPQSVEKIGASNLPNGEAWYAYQARVMTTTTKTPKEIHELGKAEVARIRKEMDNVIASTGFEGSFEAFLNFLRTDPQFYYDDPGELIRGYRDIAKRIDPGLIKLFATLPRLPYGVLPIPSYAEKSQTTAYYMPGSPDAARPGYFYANTYDLKTRPKWEMEALTVHEAVPGHHLQIALAQELEDVPQFRRWGGPTAFVEGWGLYSESLGEDLGLYDDPYSKFGQLTYEIWRAVRLVVDTGMHNFGWTRQQAIDYFAANSSKPIHDITVEIDRYIVWPGQALAYKIGELKFKELKQRAQQKLGDKFDIRTFHDACLENGAIPLDVLDAHIDQWIESQ